MIPILSRYDRQVFCDQFFNKSMTFLVERLDSPDGPKGMSVMTGMGRNTRSTTENLSAYLAIGHLSIALKTKLIPFIDPIFQHVKSVLQMHK